MMIPPIDPTECDHQGAPHGRCKHCCPCEVCYAERDMDASDDS